MLYGFTINAGVHVPSPSTDIGYVYRLQMTIEYYRLYTVDLLGFGNEKLPMSL